MLGAGLGAVILAARAERERRDRGRRGGLAQGELQAGLNRVEFVAEEPSASTLPADTPVYRLTPRERDVVRLLATGATSGDIADRLHLSVHTVKNHRKNILRKVGCRNSGQLVARCIAARII